jgi:hypothetical protein
VWARLKNTLKTGQKQAKNARKTGKKRPFWTKKAINKGKKSKKVMKKGCFFAQKWKNRIPESAKSVSFLFIRWTHCYRRKMVETDGCASLRHRIHCTPQILMDKLPPRQIAANAKQFGYLAVWPLSQIQRHV